MTTPDPAGRRDFVRALALGALAAPGVVAADDAPARPEADPKPDPKPIDEVEARMAIVVARFGKLEKLDEAARAAVRREVESVVRRGEALRALKVDNGDGPFPVFHPYRAPMD